MTYTEWLTMCQREQAAYVKKESARANKAYGHWLRYHDAMRALGLHALSGPEIDERFRQLRLMEAHVDNTHGDTPANRIIFALAELK